jgi:hypothetical protein
MGAPVTVAYVQELTASSLGDRSDAAVECLFKALLAAPGYTDAMFNLALLLQRKGAYAEAADYWRRYLASDRLSDWAARARRSPGGSKKTANKTSLSPTG